MQTRHRMPDLLAQIQVGDVVFIRVPFRPFKDVSIATLCWSNHVGVVISTQGSEPTVAESAFPISRLSPLSRFVARSEHGRVAVSRLLEPMNVVQRERLHAAAMARQGVFYDTGFNLHSGRQFCSRYVHEVMREATGLHLGEVESFAQLLGRNPQADLAFWRLWFFGRIPWQRQTITPASVLHSPHLQPVFDGQVKAPCQAQAA
jgi:hypothetical protein